MIDDTFHDDIDSDPDEDDFNEDRMDPRILRMRERMNRFNKRQETKQVKIKSKADIANGKGTLVRRIALLLAALKLMEDHHTDKLTKEDYDELKKNAAKSGNADIINSVQPGATASSIKTSLGDAANKYFKGLL